MKKPQTLVLVNPWIHDFAAYDLWSKPLGLLYLAGYLRECGFSIHLINCMDVSFQPSGNGLTGKPSVRRSFGTGKFFREQISNPPQLEAIQRPYNRYGIPPSRFKQAVSEIGEPAAFLVTSLMTYWYPGVAETIRTIKDIHPTIPILLGGIYARICSEHAAHHSGATEIITARRPAAILDALESFHIHPLEKPDAARPLPYPAFDLLGPLDSVCLMTSSGCPYRCRYCASHFLNPRRTQRDPHEVFSEILYWNKSLGIKDFAFYDDALLISSKTHIRIVLEEVMQHQLHVRFHTPNALHVREITRDMAGLLKQSGFRTIRLGYETSDPALHQRLDNKVSEGDFERAVGNLLAAGFATREIGAYILVGLPGQTVDSVSKTIELVACTGATPYLAEYSPIPHSDLWEAAVTSSPYDLEAEPLYHNNTLLPCWTPEQRNAFRELKKRVIEIRHAQRRSL